MKKLIILSLIFVSLTGLLFSSCEDMLNTTSNRIMEMDENKLNSPNDSVFSMLGILSKVQKLTDRYIILGELRADLMDVTEFSDNSLREISGLKNISPDNPYIDLRDYYDVINNCNFFINRLDTAIRSQGKQVMLREFAAAKIIRAWTYMQLALNYGKVPFFFDPIVTLADANKKYPEYGIQEMASMLIDDLEPCFTNNYGSPDYGNIEIAQGNEIPSRFLFFPVEWILGELFLWRANSSFDKGNDYALATFYYATLINKNRYSTGDYAVRWANSSFNSYYDSWSSRLYSLGSNAEVITIVPMAQSPADGNVGQISNLCSTSRLMASKKALTTWREQVYAFTAPAVATSYLSGDLREKRSLYTLYSSDDQNIAKFLYNPYSIVLFRSGQLYLRLAEAANRAGKPAFAFAVLKQGLNQATLNSYVPDNELDDVTAIFRQPFFDSNRGIHSRGSGNSQENDYYVLPADLSSRADSILAVESFIATELALEMAFEGSRFHDLMRIAKHRNDPSFLAGQIANKQDRMDWEIYDWLMNEANWYLPVKP